MATLTQQWISSMDGNNKLFELTIPGTHDTGTWTLGSGPAKCQNRTLIEQLNAGIRFIDIRLKPSGNGDDPDALMVWHGQSDTGLNFNDNIVTDCSRFLKDNPSEFIIMSIKDESKTYPRPDVFYKKLQDVINGWKHLFYIEDKIPKISDVRGKIVVARRFSLPDNLTIGVNLYDGWPNDDKINHWKNANGVYLYVQDEYTYFNIIENKFKDYVKVTLESATNSAYRDYLFLNFTSCTGRLWPIDIAKIVNKQLSGYLNNNSGRFGIIPMDSPEYPDDGVLIKQLIRCNDFNVYVHTLEKNGVYEIHPRCSTASCLDVWGNETANSSEVKISGANGGKNQQWKLEDAGNGYYYLVPQNAVDKVLDVQNSGTANNTKTIIFTNKHGSNQKWKIEPIGNGAFTLKPGNAPNKALELFEGNAANGTNATIYDANNSIAQQWKFIQVPSLIDNGIYAIHPGYSGNNCLDVWGSKTENGSAVAMYDATGGNNQRWKIEPAGDGHFFLHPQNAPDKVLDIRTNRMGGFPPDWLNHSPKPIIINAKKQMDTKNTQKWKIDYSGNGRFSIRSGTLRDTLIIAGEDGKSVYAFSAGDLITRQWQFEHIPQ